jgi:hypothetical protein
VKPAGVFKEDNLKIPIFHSFFKKYLALLLNFVTRMTHVRDVKSPIDFKKIFEMFVDRDTRICLVKV